MNTCFKLTLKKDENVLYEAAFSEVKLLQIIEAYEEILLREASETISEEKAETMRIFLRKKKIKSIQQGLEEARDYIEEAITNIQYEGKQFDGTPVPGIYNRLNTL